MRLLFILMGLSSFSVFANDGTQTAYQIAIVSALFGFFDVIFVVFALVLFIVLVFGFFNTVTSKQNDNLMQRLDRSPVTIFRFIVGIVVLSGFLFTPMNMANFGGDIVSKDSGNTCLVVDVDASVEQFKSDTPASQCFERMLNDMSGRVETSDFNQDKMRLFLAVVQLVAVGFMGFGATMFVLNMAGFKNLSLTPGKSLAVIFASTIVFAAPALIAYAVDIFSGSNTIMGMEGG